MSRSGRTSWGDRRRRSARSARPRAAAPGSPQRDGGRAGVASYVPWVRARRRPGGAAVTAVVRVRARVQVARAARLSAPGAGPVAEGVTVRPVPCPAGFGDGAGHDAAVGKPHPAAVQIARGLQLAQGGGDACLALREPLGQPLDADPRSGGQRLDVHGEPDGHQGQCAMAAEVVADDGEVGGVPGVDVDDAGGRLGILGRAGWGARGRDILRGIHREGSSSSVVRPSSGIAVPTGAVACLGLSRRAYDTQPVSNPAQLPYVTRAGDLGRGWGRVWWGKFFSHVLESLLRRG